MLMEQFPSQVGLSEAQNWPSWLGKSAPEAAEELKRVDLPSRNGRPGELPLAHGGPFFKHEWMGSGSFRCPGSIARAT